ncbi:hypothetical protein PTSG_11665 [Salpingoeca rosetta]|uniref:DNA-directed RNA polymerase III subunit RPC6 n=1 Tax=Salpingoeca rosetta (strain ATCC 50818 / BSB-021) TaxID=946362 RepID=F2TXZ6_SALR5|nr:uncharacterized protein PTSG_11665 [Salpingoeca rosetta]EGD76255.1 hypothetical protein PTSG_11665 [Salpingoeca rosetta]|eukprot:XP_004998430.1 hypothetical protein PTSG_11665 [Salpingoeca rosetta]
MSSAPKRPKLQGVKAKDKAGKAAPAQEGGSVREKILDFLKQQNGEALSGKDIATGVGADIKTVLVEAQALTDEGKIELLTPAVNGKTKILFQLGTELSQRVAKLEPDERAIYSAVEAAGTAGIWNARFKSLIPDRKRLKRVLQQLTRDNLIKEFKPVNNSKKPHYILYDLEPDESVSGGVFYDGDEFDREFINNLRMVILLFLKKRFKEAAKEENPYLRFKHSYITPDEIASKLNASKVIKITLSPADCEKVLSTLVTDRLVIANDPLSSIKAYRFSKLDRHPSALSAVPCGICPVRHNCTLDGVVNPVGCKYLDEWLAF